MLFALLPLIALIAVVGLLLVDDVAALREVRSYATEAVEVVELVNLRSSIQDERYLLIDPNGGDANTILDAEFTSPIEQALRMRSSIDVVQVLPEARQLRSEGDLEGAADLYTSIVEQLDQVIAEYLARAPVGEPRRTVASLTEILVAQESFLQEDLGVFVRGSNPLTVVRHREAGLQALSRFRINASADGIMELDELASTPSWDELRLADIETLGFGQSDTAFEQWQSAADVRRIALTNLTIAEVERTQASLHELSNVAFVQLLTLAALIAALGFTAAIGTWLLRRSILRPLAALTRQAQNLTRGEVTAIYDPAGDEIAEVGNAFSGLAKTVDHLFGDIGRITDAMHAGDHSVRIDVEPLQGDWRRLATTMNTTLDTAATHQETTGAELARRMAMTDVSNAVVLSDSAAEATGQVLDHLPQALPGSRAQIHQHQSGPPELDFGIELAAPLSALEVPTSPEHAKEICVDGKPGVATLIELPTGPPAVLALMFGSAEPSEIEPLISLVETSGQILSQVHRRQAAEIDATHNLEHDLTTGMANVANLERWFEDTAIPFSGWTALGITPRLDDLDGAAGREAHDSVLRSIGSVLEDLVTTLATAQGIDARIVRVGDPEFVAIVPTKFGEKLANAFASRFTSPIEVDDISVPVDATIGLAEIDAENNDLSEALTNVAAAVRRGQHRATEIVPFETRYRDDARRRTQLSRWLEHAIENRELSIHFQPIVNAQTIVVEGYECLVRGTLDGKPVSPAEFIPLAEENGLIFAIGEFALREACAALPFLKGDNPYVSINLSPHELSDPAILERIEHVLSDSYVDRSRIVFEITEGAETSDADVHILEELNALGVKIAIDDFGSGHANLAQLTLLPAQILKLDRTLITPIVDDPAATAVVLKSIEMAHDLGMSVVGEGVETNEELNVLRRLRCDRVQGWFTGKPEPLDAFIEIAIDRPMKQTLSAPSNKRVSGR